MNKYKTGDIFKITWGGGPTVEEYYMLSCVPEGYIFICVQEGEDGYMGEWLSNEFRDINDADRVLNKMMTKGNTYEKVSAKIRVELED